MRIEGHSSQGDEQGGIQVQSVSKELLNGVGVHLMSRQRPFCKTGFSPRLRRAVRMWLPVSLKLGQDQDAAVGAFGARHRPDQV